MIAALLSPSASTPPPQQQGRISQLLPSVKCSSCLQPVPLDQLGDHICTPAPPVPALPKSSANPAANSALLPERLQGRVGASPSGSRLGSSPPQNAQPPPHQEHQRMQSSSSSSRLRINTRGPHSPTQASFKPSPLARSDDDRNDTSSSRSRELPYPPPNPSSSPLRTRMRTPSNAGSNHSTPSTARPPVSFNQATTPVQTNPPPSRNASPFPNSPMRGPGQGPMLPSAPGQGMPVRGGTQAPINPPPPRNGTPGPMNVGPPRNGTPGPMNGGPPPPRNGTPGPINGGPPPLRNGTPGPMNGGPPPPLRNGGPMNGPGPPRNGTPGPMNGGPRPMNPPPIQQMNGGPPPPQMNGVPFPRDPPPSSFNGPPPPGPPVRFPSRQGPPGSMSLPGGVGPPTNIGPRGMGPPPPSDMRPRMASDTAPLPSSRPNQSFVPPNEQGINTKSGGEAGMAGVGRRGFAAAARAAMFVGPSPPSQPQPSQQYGRRPPVAPQYLDIDAASRSTSTPPLSAGSGYSSHSPGPTSPLPQSEFANPPIPPPKILQRTPSPPSGPPSKPSLTLPPQGLQDQPQTNMSLSSPISNARLPFFEKYKNKLPGMSPSSEYPPGDLGGNNDTNTASLTSSNSSYPRGRPRADTATTTSSASGSSRSGGPGGMLPPRSSSASRGLPPRQPPPPIRNNPISPIDSESEYGGLAYADSTDYEDDGDEDDFGRLAERRRKGSTPSPLPPVPQLPAASSLPPASSLPASILRAGSNASVASSKIQFGSVSGRSGRSMSRERGDDRTGIRIGGTRGYAGSHSRDTSVSSSYSSVSDVIGGQQVVGSGGSAPMPVLTRTRSNSSAIAQALGLSQTPPSEYSRLGGPGVNNVEGRVGRSISGSSNGSGKRRDGYVDVRGGPGGPGGPGVGAGNGVRSVLDSLNPSTTSSKGKERAFGTAPGSSIGSTAELYRTETNTTSSASSGNLRSMSRDRYAALARDRERKEEDSVLASIVRSNTVQGVQPPDPRPIKLPTRSLTSPQMERDKSLDGLGGVGGVRKKERTARKSKVCQRCAKSIEDGRWVSMDGGGVLCEKCWKNMYLPKCRRCNLPIERAAVSSSDGQLKGKYHKECFDCNTCHKPFPDRSFYVYDGKPLCAYHYHEANDSLCAAALCGQPIEGPCAVSHTGDRYHPEHMTCEYPGYPDCRERLTEYWEVDGRMLCERHAGTVSRGASDDEGRQGKSTRAMKRVTRFIDLNLTGAGVGGAATPVGGGDRDSFDDLR